MKIINAIPGAVAAIGILGSGLAQATLDPTGGGSYIFEGDRVVLTKDTIFGPVSVDCKLALKGNVVDNGSTISITVTDGDSDVGAANDTNCDLVGFTFSWPSDPITDSAPPLGTSQTDSTWVPGTFDNVQVSTPLGNCSGDNVPVEFRNTPTGGTDLPSEFRFNGTTIGSTCTVDGLISVVPSSDLNDNGVIDTGETSDAIDIDAYH
ncbi:MAG: hypothetical protein ABGX98_08645 [Pseudomonadota bacterium]|jgi:hypothetical protein|tara:strand:+ start:4153 stop:4773 length:621 start_codon:yes stop_codon:yes gene_type:complete